MPPTKKLTTRENVTRAFFDKIDIAHSILEYLSLKDIYSFSQASRRFRNVTKGIKINYGSSDRSFDEENNHFLKVALIGWFLSLDMTLSEYIRLPVDCLERIPKHAVLKSIARLELYSYNGKEQLEIEAVFPNLRLMKIHDEVFFKGCFSLFNLKILIIQISSSSKKPMNISGIQNLQQLTTLSVQFAGEVRNLELLGKLPMLMILVLKYIENTSMPKLTSTNVLNQLTVWNCPNVKDISGLLNDISRVSKAVNLRCLCLGELQSLEVLPVFSLNGRLEEVSISRCSKLHDISGIAQARSLRMLTLDNLSSVQVLPVFLLNKRFEEIFIRQCSNLHDIAGIAKAINLRKLELCQLQSLAALPDFSLNVKLEEVSMNYCLNLNDISGISKPRTLRKLTLESLSSIEVLPVFSLNGKLEKVTIFWCSKLHDISGIAKATNIRKLTLDCLESLELLPNFSLNRKLEEVSICDCSKLHDISGIAKATNIKKLTLHCLESLEVLPDFSLNRKLEEVSICDCSKLHDISGIAKAINTRKLTLDCLESLEVLPDFSLNGTLEEVSIENCPNIHDISEIKNAGIRNLSIAGCSFLEERD